MRLLLVEDEPGVRWLLRETLEEAGWAVDEAAGVAEAKALLEAFPYDLLVLDLALPDGEGLEVLRFARAGNGLAGAHPHGAGRPRSPGARTGAGGR